MFKVIGIILGIAVVIVLGMAFYFGVFNPVTIETAITGPYKMACMDHIGPYKNIGKKICDTKKILDQQNIKCASACALYYDDPKAVSSDKLRSKGGHLVEENFKADIVEKIDIPQREAVIARVKAHPCVAAMKTYPKLMKWLTLNNTACIGPCMEIYHDDGVVEVQMPISNKKA